MWTEESQTMIDGGVATKLVETITGEKKQLVSSQRNAAPESEAPLRHK